MEVLYEGYMDGVDFQISDAFMINGQPGDLYECSSAGGDLFSQPSFGNFFHEKCW